MNTYSIAVKNHLTEAVNKASPSYHEEISELRRNGFLIVKTEVKALVPSDAVIQYSATRSNRTKQLVVGLLIGLVAAIALLFAGGAVKGYSAGKDLCESVRGNPYRNLSYVLMANAVVAHTSVPVYQQGMLFGAKAGFKTCDY